MEISFKKYLLSAAIGFGIGGAIWGGILYSWIPVEYPIDITGAFICIFGGIGLSIFSKDIKKILKVSGLGVLGYLIGFVFAFLGIYHLPIWWMRVFSLFIPAQLPENIINFIDFLGLNPALPIGTYWLNFSLVGIFIGLFFAISLKTKIWPVIWRGGIGFGLGSLIGPVLGNLIGNLFGLLVINYLLTFSLIGAIFGIFLAWGIYKSQKANIKN